MDVRPASAEAVELSWPGSRRPVPFPVGALGLRPLTRRADPPRRLYALPFLVDAHCHLPAAGAPDGEGTPLVRDAARLRATFLERARDMGVARLAPWADRPTWVSSALRGLTGPGVAGHMVRYARPIAVDEDPGALVDENADAGADLVKVIGTGSGLAPEAEATRPLLGAATFDAIARAARARSLPVAVHCHGGELVGECLAAEVASIEHGLYLRPADLDAMVGARVALTLTPGAYLHAEPVRLGPVLERLVRAALDAGVRLAVGTDGEEETMLGQLEALVACGMPLDRAIRAAADGWTGAGEDPAEFDRPLVLYADDPALDPALLRSPGWIADPVARAGA